jgi:hypothetical protein
MKNPNRWLELALRIGLAGFGLAGGVLRAQSATGELGIRPGSVDVTAFAGVSAPTGGENERSRLQIESGIPVGGRIGYNFDKHHAVEFSIANPLSFSGNYLYHLPPLRGRFVPYATAGIGGSMQGLELGSMDSATGDQNHTVHDGGFDRRQTALTGNFGGGVKYLLSDRFALRLDVRDVVGRYRATFATLPPLSIGSVKAGRTLNDVQITAGFVFRFGGH